jgi:hypothetical protein
MLTPHITDEVEHEEALMQRLEDEEIDWSSDPFEILAALEEELGHPLALN